MTGKWDMLGIGTCAIDEILFVDTFPEPDVKMQVRRVERHGGGLTGTALVTAARLGLRCGFADVLDNSDAADWILSDLEEEGVDTSAVTRHEAIIPIQAFIIVDDQRGTRTILHTTPQRTEAVQPSAEIIQSTRLLFVDDVSAFGDSGTLHALKIARAAGISTIADFERSPSDALVHIIDHLIVPRHFAERATGKTDIREAVRALWHDQRQAVAITDGEQGSWYTEDGDDIRHQPIFPVEVVDTTGCGDVYHGAYAAALIWGMDIHERVRLATAAAALKATQPGGRKGIPTRSELETFLNSQTQA